MEWEDFIQEEMKKDYFYNLFKFLSLEEEKYKIYPAKENIFNAFKYCKFNDTKVVILGMDPYIKPNQAHGLSFSVPSGEIIPPSLNNIFKEIKTDLDKKNHRFTSGNLEGWSQQGVLLLNTALTVRHGQSGSHMHCGWQTFTNKIISIINSQDRPIVYLLWGAFAKSKKYLINNDKHLLLDSPHPSPLSAHRGFFGNKHFSRANNFLIQNGIEPIDWFKNERQ